VRAPAPRRRPSAARRLAWQPCLHTCLPQHATASRFRLAVFPPATGFELMSSAWTPQGRPMQTFQLWVPVRGAAGGAARRAAGRRLAWQPGLHTCLLQHTTVS